MIKKLLLSLSIISSIAFADVNLYGPGGPHTALIEIAKKYTEKTGVKVNVNFGPQATWNDKAKKDADILFGASEQSALAIADDHKENFSVLNIEPLFFRRAIILTKKGNPKNIKGLRDLANKEVRVVVADGMGKSNTSGTGVWEDMIGRTMNIGIISKFRKNIVLFTPNSGSARNAFLKDEADAWITWIDWAMSNPDFGTVVEIEKDLVIYRDMNIVLKNNASKEAKDFAEYLKTQEAYNIAKKFGWTK